MESDPELKFLRILEDFRQHFAFLFGRGFELVSVIFIDQNYEDWQVTMATDDCIIKIYRYMGKLDLAFSIPQLYEVVGLLKLDDLITEENGNKVFFSSEEENPMDEVQSFDRMARLLEKYLDAILEKIGKLLILVSGDDLSIAPSKPEQMFSYN